MKRLTAVFGLVLLAATAGAGMALADNGGKQRPSTTKAYQYVVKGLCNGPEGSPLAQATYKTLTNIVNANDAPTLVRITSAAPGEVPGSSEFVLDPFGVTATACTTEPDPLPFEEGAAIITSCRRPLAVTVAYTVEKGNGSVSIDVEQIAGRKIRLSASACATSD